MHFKLNYFKEIAMELPAHGAFTFF